MNDAHGATPKKSPIAAIFVRFVPKSNPPDVLLRAIAEVMAGRIALSPDIDHQLAISRLAGEPSAVDALTPRNSSRARASSP
jgi:DNA-binding NarL/FixJ family response regulator